jgi:hypothetical protein
MRQAPTRFADDDARIVVRLQAAVGEARLGERGAGKGRGSLAAPLEHEGLLQIRCPVQLLRRSNGENVPFSSIYVPVHGHFLISVACAARSAGV